jgi:dihydrofolate reductase
MNYRYSGHGTFPCRYTWLPKAVRHLCDAPDLFDDDEAAMVKLGVGKNMVRAIRFWAEAAGVASNVKNRSGEMKVTNFGRKVLEPEKGHDEFFEDDQTLWLVHWNLSTQDLPLFAWHTMLNYWNKPDFTRSEVLAFFERETQREEKALSPVTLDEHLGIFLHTYMPTRSSKREVVEESLAGIGASLMGRNMFGGYPGAWDAKKPWKGWWGDNTPFHHPVFVLTHHAREPLELEGGTTFSFATDGFEAALERARQAAGGKDVSLAGGANAARQYLAAGLVDEMEINLAPVLLGRGERLFDRVDDLHGLELVRTVATPKVTHLKFAKKR